MLCYLKALNFSTINTGRCNSTNPIEYLPRTMIWFTTLLCFFSIRLIKAMITVQSNFFFFSNSKLWKHEQFVHFFFGQREFFFFSIQQNMQRILIVWSPLYIVNHSRMLSIASPLICFVVLVCKWFTLWIFMLNS